MLTRADHKARMDRRFYDDDPDAGMRMATAARRQRPADRQGAQGRGGEILQRRAPCSRPCPPPRATMPATSSTRRSGCAARTRRSRPRGCCSPRRAAPRSSTISTNGGSSAGSSRASCSISSEHQAAYHVARDALPPHEGKPARRARVHRRLDRAALHRESERRNPAFRARRARHHQPDHARARRILARPRARSRRAATPRRARIIRPPRSIRPPITDRSPAPGSAWASLRCAVRRSPATARR